MKLVHDVAGGGFCARRDFLKAMAALPLAFRLRSALAIQLRIGLFYAPDAQPALLGAQMSEQEAQRAAGLLGGTVALQPIALPATTPDFVAIDAAIVAGAGPQIQPVVTALLAHKLPVINALADANTIQPPKNPRLFHIRRANCEVWHATLEQFGAAQLNDRYRAAYHSPMTSESWAGWFAVKLLWESAARAGTADPETLLQFLQSPRAAFDGHRGKLLRFDASTHILDVPCLAS